MSARDTYHDQCKAALIGQFVLYHTALESAEPDRELYMAVTEKVYRKLFAKPEGRKLIAKANLRIVVFDPKAEEVKQWIP